MKKLLTAALIALVALAYALCSLGRLEAGTVSLVGAVIRCGVSGVVVYGALGKI